MWTGVENDENGIRGGSYVACSRRCYFILLSTLIGRLGAFTGIGGEEEEGDTTRRRRWSEKGMI